MSERAEYALWGSSGHAKVLAEVIASRGGVVVALFDNDPEAISALPGVPLHSGTAGFRAWLASRGSSAPAHGLVAIGGARGRDRLEIQRFLADHGLLVTPLVHPRASVCATAHVGRGSQVLANALVAADARIGAATILNHGAQVDHECVVGDGVHLAPRATLCGLVRVGDGAMIGAGAVVLPRISIGDDTLVGAGAVVTRDLPSGVVAMGNPARVVRRT